MIEVLKGKLGARLRELIVYALLFPLAAAAEESCEDNGVIFGFFNGVQTTKEQANNGMLFLRQGYSTATPSGEPITYELFYNDTEGFSDFVETFEQRLQEHNGLLAGRFELFFSAIQGGGSWWDALTSAIPALTDLPVLLADTFRASLVRELTANFGQPETFKVAQRHRDQLTHWISLDKKLLLLAHSQGNLFVNAAYDHAVALSDPKSVRVVHVAPASPRATGPHTLADLDLVINGLRLVGKVLPVTNSMVGYGLRPKGLNGERDAVGHGLLEIYLNPAVSTASRIRDHVMAALRELESPPRKPWAPYPDFASIPWAGGEEPGALYSPVTPSHELNKVVLRRSHPFVFVRRVDAVRGAYWTTPHVDGPEQGWSRTEFQGRGVDGSVQCTWGRSPVPGWLGPLPWSECQYERIPSDWHTQGRPAELDAYANVPDGTEVAVTSLTYSAWIVAFPDHETGHKIDFWSGAYPKWATQLATYRHWSEAFLVDGGKLLNEEAIRGWRQSREAHQTQEAQRYSLYWAHRTEYERRRKLCEVVTPPPPPPPSETCNHLVTVCPT